MQMYPAYLTGVTSPVSVRVVSNVQFSFGHCTVLVKIHDAVGALDTTATHRKRKVKLLDTCYDTVYVSH